MFEVCGPRLYIETPVTKRAIFHESRGTVDLQRVAVLCRRAGILIALERSMEIILQRSRCVAATFIDEKFHFTEVEERSFILGS